MVNFNTVSISLCLTFILTLQIYLASGGQMCLSCKGVILPEECAVVTKCGDHEECYLEEYSSIAGHVRYNLGCRASYRCRRISRRDEVQNTDLMEDSPFFGCQECCNGSSLCNNGGLCQTKPFDYHNGSLCYTCDQQESPDDCNSISLCSQDEMCYIGMEQVTTSRHLFWKTKCVHKSACNGISRMHNIASQHCQECCKGHLCNGLCNKHHESVTSSASSRPDGSGPLACVDTDPVCPFSLRACGHISGWEKKCPLSCGHCNATSLTTVSTITTDIIAVSVTPEKCEDKHVLCKDMKASCVGHKEIRIRCPYSCGTCSKATAQTKESVTTISPTSTSPSTNQQRCLDHDPLCRYLKSSCQNSNRVKEQCPLSCGLCNNNRSCVDHDEFCSQASAGCSKDSNVQRLCPATCGLCMGTSTAQLTNAVPTTPPRRTTLHVPRITTELSTTTTTTVKSTPRTPVPTTSSTTTTTTTTTPTTVTTTTPSTTIGVCRDAEDCSFYLKADLCPRSSPDSDYARANCTAYCNYCPGPTTPFPCIDENTRCGDYEPAMCTDMKYRLFAERFCLKFCNLCQSIQH